MIVRCYKCKSRLLVDGFGNTGANRAKQLGWRQRRILVEFMGRTSISVEWFCGAKCDPKEAQRA